MLEQVMETTLKITNMEFQKVTQNHTNCFKQKDLGNIYIYARQQHRRNPVTVGGGDSGD